jgi:hypothetical protein
LPFREYAIRFGGVGLLACLDGGLRSPNFVFVGFLPGCA